MMKLNYETLKQQGYKGYLLENAPVKVLQFGEGNFLRAFVDYFVDIANEKAGFNGKVTIVQPIAQGELGAMFREQQGLYTLYLRGFEGGEPVNTKRVISAVDGYLNPYEDYDGLLQAAKNPTLRYLVSNTTEAGIVYDGSCRYDDAPPASFPAKLTRILHERWKSLGTGNGIIMLSCELIDNNGQVLRECVQRHCEDWGLEEAFCRWLEDECLFCSTLVDRIVTGYPRAEADRLNEENGYHDSLLDTGEVFALWVIEGPEWLAEELPFAKAGLPVKVVRDHTPYKKQKVRILNGAHTSMVPVAWACGLKIVRDCMYDEQISAFLRQAVWQEIIPVVPLPKEELESFANAVVERFKNPFIDHELLSIALNTTSKWRARVLPSLEDSVAQTGSLPRCLAFSLAAYIAFYQAGVRGAHPIQDDDAVLAFFSGAKGEDPAAMTRLVLSKEDFWGRDLTQIPGLEPFVAEQLERIHAKGMRSALALLLEGAL